MENKNLLNAAVKTELGSTVAKKILLSNPNYSQLSTKKGSSTRLPSFKPPRDLLLTGASTNHSNHSNATFNINNSNKNTKKTFMPNINVARRKCSSNEIVENNSTLEGLPKSKDKTNKAGQLKRKNSNVVQMKGVFSEGLAPAKAKAFVNTFAEKAHIERHGVDKSKLNLNQKINKIEDDNKINSFLRDELDDPSQLPDPSFMPSSLPLVVNLKKTENCENIETTCEAIVKKTEKCYINANAGDLKQEVFDITSVLEQKQNPKLFLFEFPTILKQKHERFVAKKKNSKSQTSDSETDKSDNLTLLGEGFLGTLRIHENGKAFLIVGKTMIPLCLIRHSTRQEIISADFNSENLKGEVISLGNIDASFTCSSNLFEDIS